MNNANYQWTSYRGYLKLYPKYRAMDGLSTQIRIWANDVVMHSPVYGHTQSI